MADLARSWARASKSPTAITVAVSWGPGLCYPGLFYLFSLDSVVPSFAVKNFNLFYPLLQLAVPGLMLRIILSLAIPEET